MSFNLVCVCVCVCVCVSRDEFNLQVLHAFVQLHEFTDLNLVQALRQFLWSFRLPGEAQKIDRMMESFAQRYCHCNAGVFQSTGEETPPQVEEALDSVEGEVVEEEALRV